jgi:DNA repair exonuclease SbcCD ATPase subunit
LIKQELHETQQELLKMKDEMFLHAEHIDKKQEEIVELEKELQKSNDEVNLRKTVIDSMGENLLKHEDDSMRLIQKLAMMKNQILEYDKYVGMNRKYGAVRVQALKNTPVTVSSNKCLINLFLV